MWPFKKKVTAENIDDPYVDQARFLMPGFYVFYTPWGLKELEQNYINAIRASKSKKEDSAIKKAIQCNPHLHKIIKDNLILNIKIMRKQREGK